MASALEDSAVHPCRYPLGRHTGVRERIVAGYKLLYSVDPDTGDNQTAGDVRLRRVFGPYQDSSRL